MKLDPTPHTKFNSKWTKELKTIKLLKENRGKALWHYIQEWFLRYNTNSTSNKRKKKSVLDQNSNLLCISGNRVLRQPTEWEEIFANHLSGKGLISAIYIFFTTPTIQQPKTIQK